MGLASGPTAHHTEPTAPLTRGEDARGQQRLYGTPTPRTPCLVCGEVDPCPVQPQGRPRPSPYLHCRLAGPKAKLADL